MDKPNRVSRLIIYFISILVILAFGSIIYPNASCLEDVNNLIKQGKDLYENGSYDNAISVFLEALDQSPILEQEAEIRFNLALSYFASARNEKMKEQLGKLFTIQPNRTIDMTVFPPDFVEAFIVMKHNPSLKAKTSVSEVPPTSSPRREIAPIPGSVWTDPATGMQFLWIPGGEFEMGSNSGNSDEKPAHKVYVDGFWMGKYEVTQGEWRAVLGSNPSFYIRGDNYPVEQISSEDIQHYLEELNSKAGDNYRLPTEAEWEYACRAGTKSDRYGNLDGIAWHHGNSGNSTHPVGQKQKNPFGLYDMLGNVWEWCQDKYGGYVAINYKNPTGASLGSTRVVRGGSCHDSAQRVRASFRRDYTASSKRSSLGFRLAITK